MHLAKSLSLPRGLHWSLHLSQIIALHYSLCSQCTAARAQASNKLNPMMIHGFQPDCCQKLSENAFAYHLFVVSIHEQSTPMSRKRDSETLHRLLTMRLDCTLMVKVFPNEGQQMQQESIQAIWGRYIIHPLLPKSENANNFTPETCTTHNFHGNKSHLMSSPDAKVHCISFSLKLLMVVSLTLFDQITAQTIACCNSNHAAFPLASHYRSAMIPAIANLGPLDSPGFFGRWSHRSSRSWLNGDILTQPLGSHGESMSIW